ncbi:MFS general substrate transporter [Delitschia confertaspora ATCC 74209]|uniref:MFS general substrate transporter n=1 Tax=Delitschia confertaspora ATCC 74209 TaxID=1513339 RepID=A0A9P4MTJ1_9PLEO|nr:MFS general substrate transporter [Delitschia confertaspora ATCC 74209]
MEKHHVDLTEDVGSSPSMESPSYETEFTPEQQKKIIHRIDRRLVVTVGVLYCISLMDRTNMSAASIAGMTKELKLYVPYGDVSRYSVATLVFFTSYIVCQPPSTVLVRKIGPRIHLSFVTTAWGAVMIGMGFTKDWRDLSGLRVVLGVLEAGFFPSCVYLLSTWYTRFDVGKRYSIFYMLGCFASACSGILAYGLMQMEGLQGLGGWRWIFIIEGVLTCVLGIGAYWALVDFPDKAHKSWRFLTEREAKFIIDRVDRDRGDAKPESFNAGKFFRAGLDIKIWAYALIFCFSTTLTYALAFFLPIILSENMGFDTGTSQCLAVAPPYAFAGIIMYTTGWLGDKYRVRSPIIVFNMVLCLIGLPIMGFHKNAGIRYFGVFLVTAGANSNVPATMAYQANNIRGQWKRAFCSATLVGFGGVGGIAGSLVFRTQDSPTYHLGLYACIVACLLNLIIVGLVTLKFWYSNKKADRGEIQLEADAEDAQPGFRYTY